MASVKGGNKLSAALQKIAGGVARGRVVQAGFFETETYPDGTLVAMVAAIQDFGAPSRGIPPRPFFRNAVASNKDAWPDELARVLVAEDYDAERTLSHMGARIAGEIQESIEQTNSPPLAPATIARKGFDKPLIDTGRMIQSVTYKVKT